jgi:hypothetical protein
VHRRTLMRAQVAVQDAHLGIHEFYFVVLWAGSCARADQVARHITAANDTRCMWPSVYYCSSSCDVAAKRATQTLPSQSGVPTA